MKRKKVLDKAGEIATVGCQCELKFSKCRGRNGFHL
jgi:hypothetical protein